MKTKVTSLLFLFLLSFSVVQAATLENKHSLILSPGEAYAFALKEYSYVNVRMYEGNKVSVSIGQSITNFTLEEINQEGTAVLKVERETTRAEEISLPLGAVPAQVQIQDAIPIVFVETIIFHPAEAAAEKYAVIKYTVPSVKNFNREGEANATEKEPTRSGVQTPEQTSKDPYLKYFLAVIIILLIIIIILGPKEKPASPSPPAAEEKPKSKRVKKEESQSPENKI